MNFEYSLCMFTDSVSSSSITRYVSPGITGSPPLGEGGLSKSWIAWMKTFCSSSFVGSLAGWYLVQSVYKTRKDSKTVSGGQSCETIVRRNRLKS
ncbi:hypothetical protein RRF57_011103 [Xylaria bambusicola]|uniref:Uncharacterized protein n=1 Tax=Xylaria bambusicola TaxID=326684 RepID=A0AAN7ZCX1_9PEZI